MRTAELWVAAKFNLNIDTVRAIQADVLESAYEEITDAPTVLDAMNRIRALKPAEAPPRPSK